MDATGRLHILHIEDDKVHAELIRRVLAKSGLDCRITLALSRDEYLDALQAGGIDLILSDSRGYDFDGLEVLRSVRRHHADIPFIFVSGSYDRRPVGMLKSEGAADCLLKSDLDAIAPAIRRTMQATRPDTSSLYLRGMERLVVVVQELSLARDLDTVMRIVRHAARELTGADGASFVLRDGDFCHYADEEAIAPLWKGQRFPLSSCVSGWAMQHREAVVIEDIYADPRVPHDAYRPTFVQSMAMVPIRTLDPLGAIGNYWATRHVPSEEEVKLLRALADTTAVALENVRVYSGLEASVRQRTVELEAANKELEAFSYSVSHDLRGPLRSISGFGKLLADEYGDKLDETAKGFLAYITGGTKQISELIEALLELSRVTRAPLTRGRVDLSALAREVADGLSAAAPERQVGFDVAPGLVVQGDLRLIKVLMQNLMGNAWKFTARHPAAHVSVGEEPRDGERMFFVRDDGAGFDMAHAKQLFTPFHRQHRQDEFAGTGIGLATVQRIVQRHHGKIWAESAPEKGATFFFTLDEAGVK